MHTRAGRTSRRMEAHSQLWHKIIPLKQRHVALAFGAVALIISSFFIIVSVLNTPQKSMETKIAAYSIWAIPSRNSSHRLSLTNLINAMSRKYGTYPFAPHVTVIGSFGPELGLTDEAAVAGMKYLSHVLKPYDMEVMDIASGHEYFRCVYLRMVKSKQVLNVNWKAKSVFGLADSETDSKMETSEYMPHLSLVYADLSEEVKEAAKTSLRAADIRHGGARDVVGQKIHVSSLALYRTDPSDKEMKSWELLGEFNLEGE